MAYLNSENTVVTDQSYKRDYYVLYSWQRITRTLDFYCKKRGYYEINNADIRSMSLLMDRKFYKKNKQNSYLYVYPKRIPTDRIDLPFNKIIGNILTKRYIYEDPFQFQGIREYQFTDPMNRINWKASARSNDYMVNVYGYTAMVSVCIFLDVEDNMILKYETLQEESIRIASSLASRLIGAGIEVELISNGKDLFSGKEIFVDKGNGANQANVINRSLARMDLGQEVNSILPYIKKHQQETEDNMVYVLISKNQKQVLENIHEFLSKQTELVWIVPIHDDMDRIIKSGNGFDFILWEVDR